MVSRIVKVAVVIAIVYFGYTQVIPWIKSVGGGPGAAGSADTGLSDGGARRCIDLASRASSTMGSEMRQYAKPPFDLAEWGATVNKVEMRIYEADSDCRCSAPGCSEARQALSEIKSLLATFDGMVRGDTSGFTNPAAQLQEADRLLEEALYAAGS
ncbi:MAG: hypothetical protein WBH85_05230 [Thermoanaerobaculia bacterium]